MIYNRFPESSQSIIRLISSSTFVDTHYLQLKLFPVLEISMSKVNHQTKKEYLIHKTHENYILKILTPHGDKDSQ